MLSIGKVRLPKVGNLFLENFPQPVFDFLKCLLLLVGDGTDSIGAITVNMSGTKGETKVNESWIDHESVVDPIQ